MPAAHRRLLLICLLTLPITALGMSGSTCTGLGNINQFPHSLVWPPILVNRGANAFPNALAITDINTDGLSDVIVGYPGGDSATPSIVAFIQIAPTQWGPVLIAQGAAIAGVSSLAVGDIDSDGMPDIIAGCSGRILFLRSPINPLVGGNWFVDVINGSDDANTSGRWTDVAIVQLDKLFGPDIVACNNDPGVVSWFRAPQIPINGAQWQRQDIDNVSRKGAAAINLQDLDRDGNIDVISTARGETNASIAWYRHPGGNILASATWTKFTIGNLSDAARLDAADVNRDGLLDVVVTSPSQGIVGWYRQPTDLLNVLWGGFVLAEFTTNTPSDIKIVDLDVNAQPDVVVSTADAGSLRWFTPVNDATARWVENNQADIDANVSRIALADVDRNGRIDVIATQISADEAQDAVAWFRNPEP